MFAGASFSSARPPGDHPAARIGDRNITRSRKRSEGTGCPRLRPAVPPRPCPRPVPSEMLLERSSSRSPGGTDLRRRVRPRSADGRGPWRRHARRGPLELGRQLRPRSGSCGSSRASSSCETGQACHRCEPLDRLGKLSPSFSSRNHKCCRSCPEKSNHPLRSLTKNGRLLLVEGRQPPPLLTRCSASRADPTSETGRRPEAHRNWGEKRIRPGAITGGRGKGRCWARPRGPGSSGPSYPQDV